MTTAEFLLARKLGSGGGGGVTVEELTVTENGIYQEQGKAYTPVKVELPLDSKTITENGTYTASDDNLAGFNEVTVAVEGYAKKSIPNTPTAIATFNASALPMPSLTVGIEAVQAGNGDPSPTNIRPISGWTACNVVRTGKNIWGGLPLAQDMKQVAYQPTLDTTNKTLIFTNTKPIEGSYNNPIPNGVSYKENTQYTFIIAYKNNGMNNCLRIYYTDGNYEIIVLDNSSNTKIFKVFTTQSNKTIKDIIFSYYTNAQTYLYYEESGLFEGVLTAEDFEPYNGQTYTTALKDGQGNPMVCYGGTLDVVSGVLVVTHIIIKANTLNWYYLQNTFYSGSAGISADGSTDINSDFVCSFAKSVNKEWNQLSNNECVLRKNLYSQGYYSLCVKNTEYTNATDFKNSLDSTSEITFPIATPQTIQLTPTAVKSLLGTNNIWADSGDIQSGEYMEAL